MVIGEYHYEDPDDAFVTCNCGHTVLCNQVEDVWQDGHVTTLCDACVYGDTLADGLPKAHA